MNPPAEICSHRTPLVPVIMLAAVLIISLLTGACGESAPPGDASATTSSGETPHPVYETVSFTTEDGLQLSGRLYGSGDRAVVLSHMYPADQNSWDTQASLLAEQGYTALTFDFRGYGESQGYKDIQHLDRDVQAAVQYLQQAGANEVVLVGASMGGTASLVAASELQTLSSVRIAGAATFSAPVKIQGLDASAAVPAIQIALLFVAAEGDVGAEGARQLEALSGDRGDLQILPGSDHGTDLFTGAQSDTAWRLLLDFVRLCMPVGG